MDIQRCWVNVSSLNRKFSALISTSSTFSFIGTKIASICEEIGNSFEAVDETLEFPNGFDITLTRKYKIVLEYDQTSYVINFLLIPDLEEDIVLGVDALNKIGLQIILGDRVVRMRNKLVERKSVCFSEILPTNKFKENPNQIYPTKDAKENAIKKILESEGTLTNLSSERVCSLTGAKIRLIDELLNVAEKYCSNYIEFVKVNSKEPEIILNKEMEVSGDFSTNITAQSSRRIPEVFPSVKVEAYLEDNFCENSNNGSMSSNANNHENTLSHTDNSLTNYVDSGDDVTYTSFQPASGKDLGYTAFNTVDFESNPNGNQPKFFKSASNDFSAFTICEFLKENATTKIILTNYCQNNILSNADRCKVSKSIIECYLSNNPTKKLHRQDFQIISKNLGKIFNESGELYYRGYCNGKLAKGKLWDSYNNYRSKLAKIGLLTRKKKGGQNKAISKNKKDNEDENASSFQQVSS